MTEDGTAADGSRTFLGNIAIRWRVGAIIALGIVALAAAVGISEYGTIKANQASEKAHAFLKIEIAALKANALALLLRRREKDFIIRKDLKYLKKYEEDHSVALATLEELRSVPESEPVANAVEAVINGLNTHKAQFTKVVDMWVQLGLSEKEGLKGELRGAVHAVETKLKEAKRDELTVKMLMMRRHEKDFMLRGADKYLGRIETRRTEFDPLLTASGIPAADQSEISTMMDKYQSDMNSFGQMSIALVGETKQLSAIYAELQPSLEEVLTFADTGFADADRAAEIALTATTQISRISAGVAGIALLILGWIVMRSITSPIRAITDATEELADGNRETDIPASGNADEMGSMARALLVFKQSLAESEQMRTEREEADKRSEEERRAMQLTLADKFSDTVATICDSVQTAATDVQNSAETMVDGTSGTMQRSTTIAGSVQQASASVKAVVETTDQLRNSVSEISQQSAESSKVAATAVGEAQRTNERVQGLSAAAEKIGEVVNLISDIAEQTNLLALNATIEAARAGESGKGFAVVANEVKSLANQTAKATDDISSQVASIQAATHEAAKAIDEISATIGSMNEISQGINTAVERQSGMTEEISRNVQAAMDSTSQVTSVVEDVNKAAQESNSSSQNLLDASKDLSSQIANLNDQAQSYLSEIRKE